MRLWKVKILNLGLLLMWVHWGFVFGFLVPEMEPRASLSYDPTALVF